MKKLLFYAAFIGFLLASCSSDDDGGSNNTPGNGSFLPLQNGNYWVYKIVNDNVPEGRDSLYIAGNVTFNSNTYKEFKTLEIPMGFYSAALNENGLRLQNGKLLLSGNLGFSLDTSIPLSIPINDLIIFDENAINNQQLGTLSGVIEQSFEGIPLQINYNLKTVNLPPVNSEVFNEVTYNNLRPVKVTLNLKITAVYTDPNLPIPLTITIMDAQDVLVSTHFFAENIGVVHTESLFSFELQDLSGFGIEYPFPSTFSQLSHEFLEDHQINN